MKEEATFIQLIPQSMMEEGGGDFVKLINLKHNKLGVHYLLPTMLLNLIAFDKLVFINTKSKAKGRPFKHCNKKFISPLI